MYEYNKFACFKDVIDCISFAGKPGNIEEPHGGTLAEYGACYEYVDLLVKLAAERLFKSGEQEQKELQARGMRDGRFE